MRRGASHEDAEDFIQEAFARLTVEQGRQDIRQPEAFLYRTAPSAPLGGPLVPGVCLLSREAVFANAAVGRAATTRLAQLSTEAQAEIAAERAPLEAEANALQGLPETPENLARAQAFGQRWQALQQKAEHTAREIEATRQAALGRISDAAQPVIAEVYAGKNCGLLFDRNAALGGNLGNDLTAGVVEGLDRRMSTINFDRERLPQTAAQ
jgi:Skp family chaperone for outer membrane proteins